MTKILEMLTPKLAGRAHIYRQVLATFASSLLSLAGGITFGFTAVLLPQLKTDTNFPYDEIYDSWIGKLLSKSISLADLNSKGSPFIFSTTLK
ncbi:hypothetical protein HW555_003832 [Spodoptera exigua]|uniref:Uncharacterized protein n=1 Tax=Spodoptera exigua TaxID=7107 RepID=A0A835GKC2_SPOEX|nr:hypothetical protein HW555_003832 [Spodoptera exigua]